MITTRPLIVASCLALACCVPAADPPTPTPQPVVVVPQAVLAPIPQPAFANWMDAPASPGDWTYRADSTGTIAYFGQAGGNPDFGLRCDPSRRAISLLRAGTASGSVPMRVRTETTERMVTAMPQDGPLATLRADIAPSDPLLEAMAFSKGRFAVETNGLPTLYLPAWPEVTRIIEDCR